MVFCYISPDVKHAAIRIYKNSLMEALQVSKGRLLLRTMYVFLPVRFFRSFNASFAERIAVLNVYFFVDLPSSSSLVAAGLFSEAPGNASSEELEIQEYILTCVPVGPSISASFLLSFQFHCP